MEKTKTTETKKRTKRTKKKVDRQRKWEPEKKHKMEHNREDTKGRGEAKKQRRRQR
jgi:hypothetical protein